jgi:hypothetical protein
MHTADGPLGLLAAERASRSVSVDSHGTSLQPVNLPALSLNKNTEQILKFYKRNGKQKQKQKKKREEQRKRKKRKNM